MADRAGPEDGREPAGSSRSADGGGPAARSVDARDDQAGSERRPRSRWSWAAVLAVGLLVIAVLVPLLTRRGDSAAIQPGPKPTATVTTTPAPATATPTAAIGPPAGYVLYRDPTGWSIAVPKAWRAARAGAAVTFRDGDRVLRVTHRGNPPRDPYAAQLQLEPTVKSKIQGYDFMRIARVPYRDWPTADWEYRAGADPVMHTVIRSTIPTADQVYDISWTTQDRRWSEDRAFFDTVTRTFDPGA